ncbi:MAG: rhomboid family intramembrane serine protease [Flavisolibacter sp.]|nr:rhomboid family intramembrane serine protease [Flavisolibacter sp.]
MPQHQQTIAAPSYSASQILQLAFGCFHQLGWTVEYAFENRLAGYTKKKWGAYYDHILVDSEDGQLTVTSKLPEGAAWDLFKKNKKNVEKFVTSFQRVKTSAMEADVQLWQTEIEQLQNSTSGAVEQEAKDIAETEAVMKLSSGSRTVTYVIMGINVIVFLAMVVSGVHIFEPLVADIAKWGGNFKPYTTSGQWWRLITSTFVHIGIIHIAFNMYALYMAGVYLEPMLGKLRFIIAYLCTGVLASIASIWWSNNVVSAGASGAIFGLYGLFLALLTTKLIPAKMRSSLLSSIVVFIIYNLLYGAKSEGIDNAAHIGGLLSGFVIGYVYFLSLRSTRFSPAIASMVVAAATTLFTVFYLKSSGNDHLAYEQKLEKLWKLEEEAVEPLKHANVDPEFSHKLTHISQVKWGEAKNLMDETDSYKLNEPYTRLRKLLKEYIDLRIQQTNLIVLSMQENHDADVESDLKTVSEKINEKIKEIQSKQ